MSTENILPIGNLLLKGISKEYTTTAGYFNVIVMISMLVIYGVQQLLDKIINIFEKIVDAIITSKLPNARFSRYTPINPVVVIFIIGILTITCLGIVGKYT